MKPHTNRRHTYSLMQTIRHLSFLAIPLIIINIIISVISIINIRTQNLESISNSVRLYQENTADKIKSIQHFIQWSVVNEQLIEDIENAQDISERKTAIDAIRTRVNDSQYTTGAEFHYFMYLKDQDVFFNASKLHLSYQKYLDIKDYLLDLVNSGKSVHNNCTWQSVTLNGTTYLYYPITYYNCTFVNFIQASDLIAPLVDLRLGDSGSLVMKDLNGNTLYASQKVNDTKRYTQNSPYYNLITFSGADSYLPFDIQAYVDSYSNIGQLLIVQFLVILTALCLCLILCGFMFYLYRKVIKPIHEFSENLSNLNEQDTLIDLQSSHIQELEQASLQFKNLIREVTKLKINLYENELDKQKFEINFLQNQIRPHFYLNCLTTISSMAQLGKYKDIESMVLFTSRYLRYLFQTDQETVQIEYELLHIQAYLDIQALRYGPIFQYQCTIDESDKKALIPPLLLITFIENIIKHSIASDGLQEICLTVSQIKPSSDSECRHLSIHISDSGQGFPADILDKLNHGQTLTSESAHIGISNNIKRLGLLYGTDYSISFYNGFEKGAHIEIRIPYNFATISKKN
ncbi:MAG TPA: histidine kinase [Candidatus Pelethocola excrementipullorum]|nr:histidine kinase [Candidatus Pelethocola excrementipullorum]